MTARAQRAPSKLSRHDPREPLTITVVYRGGGEAWCELRARGRVWRRPGYVYLWDVLEEIWEGAGGKER